MKIIDLIGRVLFSSIFVISTPGLFDPPTIETAAAHGVPFARIAVPLAGIVSLLGGLSIAFGYYARWGAWLLVLFLVPVTWKMHPFWNDSGPDALLQLIMFMKNISLLGAALHVASFGSGPLSMDSIITPRVPAREGNPRTTASSRLSSEARSWREIP
jgi:putative oxidoreductase